MDENQCYICGKLFANLAQLRRHSVSAHGVVRHWCSACGKSFSRKDNLLRHERSLHSDGDQGDDTSVQSTSALGNDVNEGEDHIDENPSKRSRATTHSEDGVDDRLEETPRQISLLGSNVDPADDTSVQSTSSSGNEENEGEDHIDENPSNRSRDATHSEDGVDDRLDAEEIPREISSLDSNVARVYHEYWSAIRTMASLKHKLQDVYNFCLTSLSPEDLRQSLQDIFEEQTTAFKLNFSYGFVLRNQETNELRYFHSSHNNNAFMDEPVTVRGHHDLEAVFQALEGVDVLEACRQRRPDSKWMVEIVTNVTFYVTKMSGHPIGAPMSLPPYVTNNRGLWAMRSGNSAPHDDHLCFFRCLAAHRGHPKKCLEKATKQMFRKYKAAKKIATDRFHGVTLDEMPVLQALFRLNIYVYELEEDEDGRESTASPTRATSVVRFGKACGC